MSGMFAIATYPIAATPTVNVTVTPPPVIPITIGLTGCFGYTTAGDLIRRALQNILVEAADSTLQPDEYQDGLDILNDYMASLEAQGVRLGYTRCCNISDIVTVPDGAMRGIASNLAIDLAPQFGGRVSGGLVKQAAEGMKALYRLGVNIGTSTFPVTLPMASSMYRTADSYTRAPFGVMTLSGNRRVTELTTLGQALKVQGIWSVNEYLTLTPDIGGRILNNGEGMTVEVYAEFNLKSTVTSSGGVVAITKNNALALYSEGISLSTTPVSALIQGTIALEAGDFLNVFVGDTAQVNDITVIDCLVRVTGA